MQKNAEIFLMPVLDLFFIIQFYTLCYKYIHMYAYIRSTNFEQRPSRNFIFSKEALHCTLLAVKLPYGPVCPYIGCSIGLLVGRLVTW